MKEMADAKDLDAIFKAPRNKAANMVSICFSRAQGLSVAAVAVFWVPNDKGVAAVSFPDGERGEITSLVSAAEGPLIVPPSPEMTPLTHRSLS